MKIKNKYLFFPIDHDFIICSGRNKVPLFSNIKTFSKLFCPTLNLNLPIFCPAILVYFTTLSKSTQIAVRNLLRVTSLEILHK